MFDAKESILPNGIKLVAIKKDTRMMALHAGIKIGSVYENVDEKGISHFIEHMLFKGTKSRNNEKLNRDLEALGGEYNAYTDTGSTVYSITALWVELERSLDIVSDMLMNSIFPGDEIEREREVILSEIRAGEDDVEEYSFRKTNELAFRRGPLRYDIAGNKDTINEFKRDDLIAFYSRYYVPNNCFISVVSPCEYDRVYSLVLKYFGAWRYEKFSRNKVIVEKNIPCKKVSYKRDIGQNTIIYLFTFYGLSKREELALRILDHKFGESGNSILFRKLREEKGLAYDVYSDLDLSDYVKTLYIYTSVREEGVESAVDVIEKCIDKIKNREIVFGGSTIALMKKVLKTSVAFTLENPVEIGNYILCQSMKGDSIYRFINDIKEIENIGEEDIHEVAKTVFKNPTIHILKKKS
ncbi:MAG TPA: peptidase M16 [Clostridium sp.]|jgi:predicted Zn-dependent peptidase|uniref:M16 family metallopeptidase n=1 Tax=Clostridium lapidicellarium TaxID=3240931 RepID=A0ABV4DZT7_9CLOT|nr:pitrilysin family protein [uncultured Clostridium sp.]NLU06782.1 insulinase family protein [Clostridiales bacterium]HBC95920.1 peptidase M16 [Clostridium sp.]